MGIFPTGRRLVRAWAQERRLGNPEMVGRVGARVRPAGKAGVLPALRCGRDARGPQPRTDDARYLAVA